VTSSARSLRTPCRVISAHSANRPGAKRRAIESGSLFPRAYRKCQVRFQSALSGSDLCSYCSFFQSACLYYVFNTGFPEPFIIAPKTQSALLHRKVKMPQSKEFWTWAKEMREHERRAPEDERVYLCILHLDHKQEHDRVVEKVATRLEATVGEARLRKMPSFCSNLDESASSGRAALESGPSPRANTPAHLLTNSVFLKMPDMVRKWHEIGFVNRHWAIEVRGQIYELYRVNTISAARRRTIWDVPRIRERLTARLYVGRTHMADDVLLEIGWFISVNYKTRQNNAKETPSKGHHRPAKALRDPNGQLPTLYRGLSSEDTVSAALPHDILT